MFSALFRSAVTSNEGALALPKTLDAAIAEVVGEQLCTGCGACCQLDAGLTMTIDAAGFARPVRDREQTGDTPEPTAAVFDRICPGRRLTLPHERGQLTHPTMGRYLEAYVAWAADPEIRTRGSSGGALTALATWRSSPTSPTLAATASSTDPRRTVPVTIMSRDEALAAAGSRYAPVPVAQMPDGHGTVVGKPCEIAALRQLDAATGTEERPLYLSFFCAGTPSQWATDGLVTTLGFGPGSQIDDLWYRGHGWPGQFTVIGPERERSLSYEESWGKHLGRSLQWRCKICPDGIGEFGDLTAADFWEADDKGYPSFEEQSGRSALIVRTEYGRRILHEAVTAGVLHVEPLDLDALARVQPLQVSRRLTLVGRLVGSRLSHRKVPRYRGFPLVRLALRHARGSVKAMRATRHRLASSGRTPVAPDTSARETDPRSR